MDVAFLVSLYSILLFFLFELARCFVGRPATLSDKCVICLTVLNLDWSLSLVALTNARFSMRKSSFFSWNELILLHLHTSYIVMVLPRIARFSEADVLRVGFLFWLFFQMPLEPS